LLRQALSFWRGPALADIADGVPLLGAVATAMEEERLTAVEQRIRADLTAGRHRELTGELAVLVAAYPFREQFRAHQMVALYRCGRQAEALEGFRQLRVQLTSSVE
jgi:DNA-binding SARP family transcriptional activator